MCHLNSQVLTQTLTVIQTPILRLTYRILTNTIVLPSYFLGGLGWTALALVLALPNPGPQEM